MKACGMARPLSFAYPNPYPYPCPYKVYFPAAQRTAFSTTLMFSGCLKMG